MVKKSEPTMSLLRCDDRYPKALMYARTPISAAMEDTMHVSDGAKLTPTALSPRCNQEDSRLILILRDDTLWPPFYGPP